MNARKFWKDFFERDSKLVSCLKRKKKSRAMHFIRTARVIQKRIVSTIKWNKVVHGWYFGKASFVRYHSVSFNPGLKIFDRSFCACICTCVVSLVHYIYIFLLVSSFFQLTTFFHSAVHCIRFVFEGLFFLSLLQMFDKFCLYRDESHVNNKVCSTILG